MARKETVVLISDLNGEEMEPGEGETVRFGLDGVDYETDLFADQADDLRKVLADYITNARRVGGRAQRGRAVKTSAIGRMSREQSAAVRNWWRSQGNEIADRGRIPGAVLDAFERAHEGSAA